MHTTTRHPEGSPAMPTTDQPAALTCTYDTSSRGSYSPIRCGREAVSALQATRGYNETKHTAYEPRCRRHATLATKHFDTVVDLTPEVTAAIAAEAEADAAIAAQRKAAKREENARVLAAATIEEQRISTLRYRAISDPESKVDWGATVAGGEDLAQPVTIAIARWRIVQVDEDAAARDLFDSTVAISEHLGEQRLEVRTSSRLTPNQARALVAALTAALNDLA